MNHSDNPFLGVFPQFRIDREGEGLPGSLLAVWKVSFPISKITKAFLEVDGNWIVDFNSNLSLAQGLDDLITLGNTNDELIIDMTSVRSFCREDHRGEPGLGKESAIGGGVPLSGF